MSKPNPARMNYAITAAASLVLGEIGKAVDNPNASARSLSQAILPAFGISWGRDVINAITRGN